MASSSLKSAWPYIAGTLVATGLSCCAYRHYQRIKAKGGCASSCKSSCSGAASASASSATKLETDQSTLSNYEDIRVTHFHLNVAADFEKKVLSGFCDVTAKVTSNAGVSTLVLDTRHLTVTGVKLRDGADLKYAFDKEHDVMGSALTITLDKSYANGASVVVRITYSTSPSSSAIQWLPPSQTAGKKHPYLFTQCQAIHARALLPCQDTPAVKATYTGAVTVPAPLTALMSAVPTNSTKNSGDNTTTFNFEQKTCMPSYLVAIAIGALEKRDISNRCAVWSEKETVEAGLYEFAETEKFLAAAESICGEYVWGRYDVLLLPPSFPYGGMENPCLTFVTPTLLAGDRSLANVVAHEIAHSWMGNLVTNVNWAHFWMNEGFTVFVERKILQKLYGKQVRDLHASMGWKALKDSVDHFIEGKVPEYSRLVPPIKKGTDPDDVFSSVPYERGFNLLFYLEGLIGEELMSVFIKEHVKTHAYGHVETDPWIQEFLAFARKNGVAESTLKQIDWENWKYRDGMPPVEPKFDRTLIERAADQAALFADGKTGNVADVKQWSSAQTVVCLERLEAIQLKRFEDAKHAGTLSATKAAFRDTLQKIDAAYGYTASQNSEVVFRWLAVSVRADWEEAFPAAVKFLTSQGRMKFVRPLYRHLFQSEKGSALAVSTFQANSSIYHSIAQKMVAKDLGIAAK